MGSYVLGLGLIVIGQAVGALQFCLEEHLMVERGLSPVVLVGWEGLWGILYFCVLAPVLSLTPDSNVAAAALWHEDFAETFDQLAHSGDLVALTLASALALLLYNLAATRVQINSKATIQHEGALTFDFCAGREHGDEATLGGHAEHPGELPHAGRLAHVARFILRVP